MRNLFYTWKKYKSFGLYSICFNGTCSARNRNVLSDSDICTDKRNKLADGTGHKYGRGNSAGEIWDMHIEIMAKYVVGCLLAAILERKTYKNDKMDIELRKNCGFRRRKSTSFVRKKIRRWQKNRIPKFMQQRFVKEIELQEKSMIMWDMCCLERFC